MYNKRFPRVLYTNAHTQTQKKHSHTHTQSISNSFRIFLKHRIHSVDEYKSAVNTHRYTLDIEDVSKC